MKQTTDQSFEQDVLSSPIPVLVDFWAPWCGPCRMLSDILEDVAPELSKISIVKINIDENQTIATKYGVRSIPTLMLFSGGNLIGTKLGLQSAVALKSWIEQTAGQGVL